MDYGLIVSVLYAAIYGAIFFAASIYCVLEVLEALKRSKASKAQPMVQSTSSDMFDDAPNSQSDKPETFVAIDDQAGRAATVTQDEAKHADTADDYTSDKRFAYLYVYTFCR